MKIVAHNYCCVTAGDVETIFLKKIFEWVSKIMAPEQERIWQVTLETKLLAIIERVKKPENGGTNSPYPWKISYIRRAVKEAIFLDFLPRGHTMYNCVVPSVNENLEGFEFLVSSPCSPDLVLSDLYLFF